MHLPKFTSLLVTIQSHIATITLNRPDKRNAFNDDVICELTEVFKFCGEQADVRAVVLTGSGKAFCAGADLNWMRAMADYTRDENLADADKLAQMLATIYHCPKPTIAAIQGDVYAGGMGLVATCDIAIAVDTANFCLSEVKLGLIPATISPYVIRAMGTRAAHRYFLTAEVFDAVEAKAIGFVHEMVGENELSEKVAQIIKNLVNASPNAVKNCKQLLQFVAYTEIDDKLIADTVVGIADIRASDEGKEGVQSFLQKRKPNWITNK